MNAKERLQEQLNKYQDQIQELAEKIITLDPEENKHEYTRLRTKLLDIFYRWLTALPQKNHDYMSDSGSEAIIKVTECLKYYKDTSKPFCNYCLKAIHNMLDMQAHKKMYQDKGFEIPEKTNYQLLQYKKILEELNFDTTLTKEKEVQEIARRMNISNKRVEELSRLYKTRRVTIDKNDDDDSISYAEWIPDTYDVEQEVLEGLDDYKETKTGLRYQAMEATYDALQERTKIRIAKILTATALKVDSEEILTKYSFFDEEVYRHYQDTGEIMNNKQIAKALGISEASLSRTWIEFRKK